MSNRAIFSFPLSLTAEEQTQAGIEALKSKMRERLGKPDLDISIDIQGDKKKRGA